MISLQ